MTSSEWRQLNPERAQRLLVRAIAGVLLIAGSGLAIAGGAAPRMPEPVVVERGGRTSEPTVTPPRSPEAGNDNPDIGASKDDQPPLDRPRTPTDRSSRRESDDEDASSDSQGKSESRESDEDDHETVRPELRDDDEDSDDDSQGDTSRDPYGAWTEPDDSVARDSDRSREHDVDRDDFESADKRSSLGNETQEEDDERGR